MLLWRVAWLVFMGGWVTNVCVCVQHSNRFETVFKWIYFGFCWALFTAAHVLVGLEAHWRDAGVTNRAEAWIFPILAFSFVVVARVMLDRCVLHCNEKAGTAFPYTKKEYNYLRDYAIVWWVVYTVGYGWLMVLISLSQDDPDGRSFVYLVPPIALGFVIYYRAKLYHEPVDEGRDVEYSTELRKPDGSQRIRHYMAMTLYLLGWVGITWAVATVGDTTMNPDLRFSV